MTARAEPEATHVRFFVLGGLQVSVGGADVPLRRLQVRSLLAALLAADGEYLTADGLIETLWPEALPASPDAALRTYVANLRKALRDANPTGPLPAEVVEGSTAGGYRIRLGSAASCDANDFERALRFAGDDGEAIRTLRNALALWHGPAFGSFAYLRGVDAAANRLDELRLRAGERLGELLLRTHRLDEAGAVLADLVVRDPLNERAHELWMRALHASGRPAQALELGGQLRNRLHLELGLEAGPWLPALERLIRSQAAVTNPAATADAGAPPAWLARADRGPFAGRARELQALQAWFGSSTPVATIRGAAGIGKTRLAARLVGELRRQGTPVFASRCFEALTSPFEPLASVVAQAAAFVGVASPFPEAVAGGRRDDHRRGADSGDELTDLRRRLVDAVVAVFAEIGTPVLVLLDDAQWASTAALQTLAVLLDRLDPATVRVLLTIRDDADLLDDAATRASVWEVRSLIEGRARLGEALEITLPGLDTDAVAELVLGADPGIDATTVQRTTGGNPFFIAEILNATRSGGTAAIPPSVHALLDRRLTGLEHGSQALAAAAVYGFEFTLHELRQVLAIAQEDRGPAGDGAGDDRALEEAIDAAARLNVVHRTPTPGGFAFTHGLMQSAVYERIGPLRCARLHRAAAAFLRNRARERGPTPTPITLAAVARHLLEAAARDGDTHDAIAAATDAGRALLGTLDVEDARNLLRDAERLGGDTVPPATRAELLLLSSEAEWRLGHEQEGTRLAQLAAETFAAAPDSDLRHHLRAVVLSINASTETPAPQIDPLLARLGEDTPGLLAQATVLRASELAATVGEPAVAHFDRAEELARRDADPASLIEVLLGRIASLRGCDTLARRVGIAEELAARSPRLDNYEQAVLAQSARREVALERADLETADEAARTYRELAVMTEVPRFLAGVEQRAAMRALLEGRYEEAERHATAVLQHMGSETDFLAGYGVQLLLIRRDQGRIAEVEPLVAAAAADSPVTSWRAAHAMVLADLARSADALDVLDTLVGPDGARLAHLARDPLWHVTMATIAETIVALDGATGAGPTTDDRLVRLSRALRACFGEEPDRVVVVAGAAACWGATARFSAPLAHLEGRLDEARELYRRSIRIHERMNAWPFLARDHLAYAAVLRDLHRDDDADTHAQAGAAMASRIGLVGLPARAQTEAQRITNRP